MFRHFDNPALMGGKPWHSQEYKAMLWVPIYPHRWLVFGLEYHVFPGETRARGTFK
jgi:hypothetical protein